MLFEIISSYDEEIKENVIKVWNEPIPDQEFDENNEIGIE